MTPVVDDSRPNEALLDPELLALDPPLPFRRLGTLVVMAFTAACALVLSFLLRLDVAYVFAPSTPVALGDVLATDVASLPTNRYVSLSGAPMVSNAVYYRRAIGGKELVAFSLAGQRDVWVEAEVGADRNLPFARREFRGRLVRVSDLGGRFEAVRRYLHDTLHQPVDGSSYLLVADETPARGYWAILLVAIVLSFVAIDAYLLVRWFKPLETRDEAPASAS